MNQTYAPGKARKVALRLVFAMNAFAFGPGVWQEILSPSGPWAYYDGVAMSFWAALSLLALIGVFFPLRMLTLLVIQLSYKAIWLLGVGLPLSNQGPLTDSVVELAKANATGVVLLTLIIPWSYWIHSTFGEQPSPLAKPA